MAPLDRTSAPAQPPENIDRERYWRIVRFFVGIILHVAFFDLLLGRLWIVGPLIKRTRTERLRRLAGQFRLLAIEMGGVMIKLGQFLSVRVDVLPAVVIEELAGLQDEVPAVDPAILRRVLERELGDLSRHFAEVEMEPLAAASLGQTVRGWLLPPDGSDAERGEAVVLKVQRPGIRRIVETDLAALDAVAPWLMRYRPIRRRADVPALMAEFGETLWEELDYEQEVRNADTFKRMFAHDLQVYIPRTYPAYSGPHVIVLENVENLKITEVEQIAAQGISLEAVADKLIEVYLYQLFKEGIFHADPHPGNIFIRPVGAPLSLAERRRGAQRPFEIIFIDFGMIGRMPPVLKENLSQVLIGMVQNDAAKIIHAYDRMGFFLPNTNLDRIIEAQSELMQRLDGRNLRELSNPDPQEMLEIGQEFRDILFDFPFQVPQDFVYLGRALSILSGIASALHPEINPWYQIERYGLEMINAERRTFFQDFELNRESFMALLDTVRPFVALPSQVQRIVAAMEQGRLRVQSVDPNQERRLGQLERKVNQLGWSILGAAGIISGTLIYLNRRNGSNGNGRYPSSNGHGPPGE